MRTSKYHCIVSTLLIDWCEKVDKMWKYLKEHSQCHYYYYFIQYTSSSLHIMWFSLSECHIGRLIMTHIIWFSLSQSHIVPLIMAHIIWFSLPERHVGRLIMAHIIWLSLLEYHIVSLIMAHIISDLFNKKRKTGRRFSKTSYSCTRFWDKKMPMTDNSSLR
jgi:hypothetical protein